MDTSVWSILRGECTRLLFGPFLRLALPEPCMSIKFIMLGLVVSLDRSFHEWDQVSLLSPCIGIPSFPHALEYPIFIYVLDSPSFPHALEYPIFIYVLDSPSFLLAYVRLCFSCAWECPNFLHSWECSNLLHSWECPRFFILGSVQDFLFVGVSKFSPC